MNRVGGAWRSDRAQVVQVGLFLVAGVLLAIANWGHWWTVVLLVGFVVLLVRQALEVFVYRPQRFEATGNGAGGGFWG